jgi:hypothetical protein
MGMLFGRRRRGGPLRGSVPGESGVGVYDGDGLIISGVGEHRRDVQGIPSPLTQVLRTSTGSGTSISSPTLMWINASVHLAVHTVFPWRLHVPLW